MKRTILVFSLLIVALLVLFKISQYAYFSGVLAHEYILAFIAVVFFSIGVYFSKKSLYKKSRGRKALATQKTVEFGLSKREFEVLQEISNGLSNKEIAEKLFVSESTIKTHVSNILVKLNVRRRTQAIKTAQEFHILSH